MRKLLLGTAALGAGPIFNTNTALADVFTALSPEWSYTSTSSNVTAYDETSFDTQIDKIFKNSKRSSDVQKNS